MIFDYWGRRLCECGCGRYETDPGGSSTSFSTDLQKRICAIINPEGNPEKYNLLQQKWDIEKKIRDFGV